MAGGARIRRRRVLALEAGSVGVSRVLEHDGRGDAVDERDGAHGDELRLGHLAGHQL
jgi:hypothetical protein